MSKYVYLFSEGNKDMRELLGGKGANLCEMTKLGLPVPKGFIVTTEACKNYYDSKKKISDNIKDEILKKIHVLENLTGKKINDPKKPLLVSVRSGARASMPGMMDTILNVGLNDELAEHLSESTGNKKFVYDSYRRLIMMYSDVVCNIDKKIFEDILSKYKKKHGYIYDTDLNGDDFFFIVNEYKKVYFKEMKEEFPSTMESQLMNAVKSVFNSWNNERAIYYREINNIPDDWYTAVNVQEMVYGNLNNESATGVAFSRNPETGDNNLYGEFMINAQGEDLVSGVRTPVNINKMKNTFPKCYQEFLNISKKLERHYKDMQDMEFTIENNKLYILQTRNGKRSAKSAIRIAVDLVTEKIINKKEAISRVSESDIENSLHKCFKSTDLKAARIFSKGLGASPGAGSGKICFDRDKAIERSKNGENIILVREETSAEDIKAMAVSAAVITLTGGRTSHAAVVARGMGTCCVCGCSDIKYNSKDNSITANGIKLKENDVLSVDGTTGNIYLGELSTVNASLDDYFKKFMDIVYSVKRLGVRANAETINDIKTAIKYNCEGIGLARTEHMFFEKEKLLYFRKMILASTIDDRIDALNSIKKIQIKDFEAILKLLNGLPLTVRYLDPPLHEFLPKTSSEVKEFSKVTGISVSKINAKIDEVKEFNPMMGLRGVRLLINYPEIIECQTESLLTAIYNVEKKGIKTNLEIMIPLISDIKEFSYVKDIIKEVEVKLSKKFNTTLNYKIGTMIELPRACIKADEIAMEADFFSFGTNDLTQMSYGFSRDDSSKFLTEYYNKNILSKSPFETLDQSGVGELITIAVNKSKCVNSNIKLGICGEHGGDKDSIEFFNKLGLNYVSCSPYRIPVAALSAAKSVLKEE